MRGHVYESHYIYLLLRSSLGVSVLILEQHSFSMINANEAKYKLDL